jgi:simple sugar transport system ATP-binding protein
VRLKGKKVNVTSPVSGLANHIAYSTENRRDDGIIGDLSIRENIMLALQAKRGWLRRIPAREVDDLVRTYMDRFSVRPNDPDRPIRLLSGGNQQKVLLGRWLATNPELLLLDEPTRGIDVGAKADIQETVAELAEGGMSVVFISSELEEVVRLSERIVIMKDHQKVGEIVNGPDVTAERVVSIIAAESDEKAEAQTESLIEGETH